MKYECVMLTNSRTEESNVTWTLLLKCDLFITKCLLECVIGVNVCKIELAHMAVNSSGNPPGNLSECVYQFILSGTIWCMECDMLLTATFHISANITNISPRREQVSK